LYKRIAPPFLADGGRLAVAGVNNHIIRKGVQFCFDALFQYFEIAAGQIGAAYATVEQHIAAN
jgi:hypothetical protein